MTRSELVELVTKIMLVQVATEEEHDRLVNLFLSNVPDPHALDYLYAKRFEGLTAEEIVDKALSYKSIQL